MLIWAAFIIAGFLCAPLLRWPGFVITTILVIILYWALVGLPEPTTASYAISFVLITIAMQAGYVAGLLATAKIMQFRRNVADLGKRHTVARMTNLPDDAGTIHTRIETPSPRRGD